jgi:hypothetical protein
VRIRGSIAAATLACIAAALAVAGGGCGKGSLSRSEPASADPVATVRVPAGPVTVSPLAGTPDASPATQISFLGPSGTAIADVRVRGSVSGLHSGVLRPYSTGTGESFIPSRPFSEGEHVSVTARVVSRSRRGRRATSSFTVAHQAPIEQGSFPQAPGSAAAVQHFVSAPALTPSTVRITRQAPPGAPPGYLLLAPYQGRGTAGPMIADQHGGLVWFHPLPAGMSATNLTTTSYLGQPALEWWQGRVLKLGFGQGEDVIVDSSYHRLAAVRAGNGYSADLHVARTTPQGTAWVDAYDPVRVNLSSAGGAAGGVLNDSVIQEVDIRTGLVMWEWHAYGHIPFSESYNPAPKSSYPWDFVHVNSVDPGPHGDLLVSFRNTWSLDDIVIRSGRFRWRIGGARSSFALGPGVRFYWQHDASLQPGGTISLFDNGSDPPKEKDSRGLVLTVNGHGRRVTLSKQLINPYRTLLASSQGSMQALPGGAWLLGYGGLPDFTEFDAAGRVLLDGTLGPGVQNFRTTIAGWTGQPASSPAAALVPGAARLAVSWNGATEVAAWRLLAGPSPESLAPAGTVPRSGFETQLPIPSGSLYVAAQALDASGRVIGTSPPLRG